MAAQWWPWWGLNWILKRRHFWSASSSLPHYCHHGVGGGQWRQDLVIDLNVTISSLLCPYLPSKLGDFCGSFNLVAKGFINTLVSFWCEIQLFWCVNCCPNLFVFCFMFVFFFMFVCLFVIYSGQFQLFRCVHCCPNLFVCLLFEANFNSFGVSTANCSP